MTPTIRPCTPDDAGPLTELLLPVFRAGDTYTVDPDISPEGALAFWTAPGKTVFVAEDKGMLLGTYYIRANQDGGGAHVCNCGYITALEVRGRGVARALLDHSLRRACADGYRAMQYNFVVATNTRAIALWERAGFRTIGRLPGAFAHPTDGFVDALIMWTDLPREDSDPCCRG